MITACESSRPQPERSPPPEPEAQRAAGREWFTDITSEAGLDFVHESGATGSRIVPEITGGGVALFDADNDGDLDIYLTTGHHLLPEGLAAESPVNRLFLQSPEGRFHDATEGSGLGDGGYGQGVAVGDIDNDGDADIYVANFGPDRLYRNGGTGAFDNITAAAGIEVGGWSASATFFDYDRDGYLDLYVAQYVTYDPEKTCFSPKGAIDYCGPKIFPPAPDVLLHNNGDGTFTDVTAAAGISSISSAGLGVVAGDFNEDGWQDLYVANDGYANQLWINQKDGSFWDEATVRGVSVNLHGRPEAGMGVIAEDLDNDGNTDLFLTHLEVESNTFYRNLGRGLFADATGGSGLGRSSMRFTGFGTAAFDVELDGDLDLVVANGAIRMAEGSSDGNTSPLWQGFVQRNLFYLNDGKGHFALENDLASSFCELLEVSRGLAIGDVDSDGDIDFVLTNIQGPARLYRNDAPRKGHWLSIRARNPLLKRDAIGARVTIHAGELVLTRTIKRGFSYVSSNEPAAHFGLGGAGQVDRIEVGWPDGLKESFQGAPADQALLLTKGAGSSQK